MFPPMSRTLRRAALGAVLFICMPSTGGAQTLSGVADVDLQGTVGEALTVTVTGGGSASFTLVPGASADAEEAVTIETQWTVGGLVGAVALYAYFDVPAQALTDGAGNDIPSSAVEGQMTTGSPLLFTSFAESNPVGTAGGSLKLFEELIVLLNRSKTRTDALNLRVDLTSLPQLPAGTYTGTLHVRARAL